MLAAAYASDLTGEVETVLANAAQRCEACSPVLGTVCPVPGLMSTHGLSARLVLSEMHKLAQVPERVNPEAF